MGSPRLSWAACVSQASVAVGKAAAIHEIARGNSDKRQTRRDDGDAKTRSSRLGQRGTEG